MSQLSVATYAELRKKVEEELLTGQQKIEEARVQTYWNTGRYIEQHLLFHKDRADYGDFTLLKLSKDLDVGKRLLERVLQFYRAFPSIASAGTQLSWTHYRALLAIPDEKKRLSLAEEASKEGWVSRELEVEIRNLLWDKRVEASDGKPPSLLPVPVLGPFYTYQITNLDEFSKTRRVVVGARATTIQPESIHPEVPSRVLDVGFSFKKDMSLFPSCRLPVGTVVTSLKNAKGHYSLHVPRSTHHVNRASWPMERGAVPSVARGSWNVAQLYTYKAYAKKVIDGDTLKVELDIGFGDWHGETLRLKGIDCPEIDTAEGKRAKAFVEAELKGCSFIIVKSTQTRREKWGRYLADVFIPARNLKVSAGGTGATRPECYHDKSGKLIYLNNLLLENGHAVRVRG